jgi:hypothetical protein
MKKQYLVDLAGILLFYLVIILGVIGVNARFEQIYGNNNVPSLNR